jgi:tRNA pseudouridine55 synthase
MTSAFNGLLVVDKPAGITSRDAVDRAQTWFPRSTKLGHTGTLDPLATGVLVLTLGQATRLSEYVQRMRKTYRATVRFGAISDSDDADGNLIQRCVDRPPDREAVERALSGFLGTISQLPPAYSALKTTGRRACDLARRGIEVALAPRPVEVYALQLLSYEYPRLALEIECGKGTYIRSLARDLGERLGCGGHVETLRRLRVGSFAADRALSLDTERAAAQQNILPMSAALSELHRVTITLDEALRLCRGMGVVPEGAANGLAHLSASLELAVFGPNDQFLALATVVPEKGLLRPLKVFAKPSKAGG